MSDILVTCSHDAIEQFYQYCSKKNYQKFYLVCDPNTYAVLGERVEKGLQSRGADVQIIKLTGKEIIADEDYIFQTFLRLGEEPRTCLAVGSGTLTDITRFVSHRARLPFISLPTAPSVDGFTSVGAPLVIRGYKQSIKCHAPEAVFADLQVLKESPRIMIAAGFGDMLGKYTALADWRLGKLILDEFYTFDEAVAQRSGRALKACVDRVDEIGAATDEGVKAVFMGLIETGLCILAMGHSCPAAGAEHHLSHHLEMRLLIEGRPAVLHGAKVGFSTILVAEQYEKIRSLSRSDAAKLFENAPFPSVEREVAQINAFFGPIAEHIISSNMPFLKLVEAKYDYIKQRTLDQWDEIQKIAEFVPPSQELKRLLEIVGGPVTPEGITFTPEAVRTGLNNAHFLRDRITVAKLGHLLGLW
ncbi:MAG TPA: sn-glycerol-1-phosphate dehydrogenase [Anaerolineaceae bacterium]